MSEKNVITKSLCDPSGTVKINFNEMDKSELLQMLAFMQSELEAREIVIATLKSEKCKQILYQAKYGRLNTALISSKVNTELSNESNWNNCNNDSVFLVDPFSAMQRDNQCTASASYQNSLNNESSIESNLKPVYDSQLNQLENLISSQKKAQMRMKEQIVYLENKCLKLTQALEDERNKHERDAAQGDDVLVMLEKERERLKSELEFEKSHSRKLEREVKRTTNVIEDQKTLIQNQRLAASVIIKAKKQLEHELKSFNQIINKSGELPNVDCPKFHQQDSTDNAINNHIVRSNSDHRSHETGERLKYNQIVKSTRYISHENQMFANIHGIKYSQPKESITTNISSSPPDTVGSQIAANTNVPAKTRSNKQPESLLWKTYDPKTSMSTSGQCAITSKSPSINRRQLPNVSMSNSIPVSSMTRQTEINFYKHPSISPLPITISAPITPYQKILSTPPPNSNMNSPSSFQTSMTSYGLFNIHSSPLQTGSPPVSTIYKSSINSKSDNVMINNPRSRISGTTVANIVSTVASSNPPLLRSGESSPAIPKHVYVNGK